LSICFESTAGFKDLSYPEVFIGAMIEWGQVLLPNLWYLTCFYWKKFEIFSEYFFSMGGVSFFQCLSWGV